MKKSYNKNISYSIQICFDLMQIYFEIISNKYILLNRNLF